MQRVVAPATGQGLLDGDEHGDTKLVARAGAKHAPARGERVTLRPVAEEAHLFDPLSGVRLE